MFENYTDGAKALIIGIIIVFISCLLTLWIIIGDDLAPSKNRGFLINSHVQFECKIKVIGPALSNEDIMKKLKSDDASVDCKF